MVWQNGNHTDIALDVGESIIVRIKKNQNCYIYCVSPSSLTCTLQWMLSCAFQIKCEEYKPSFKNHLHCVSVSFHLIFTQKYDKMGDLHLRFHGYNWSLGIQQHLPGDRPLSFLGNIFE